MYMIYSHIEANVLHRLHQRRPDQPQRRKIIKDKKIEKMDRETVQPGTSTLQHRGQRNPLPGISDAPLSRSSENK
jgi:hypothetical protein